MARLLPNLAGARRADRTTLRGSSVDLMHVLFGTVLALNDEGAEPDQPDRRGHAG